MKAEILAAGTELLLGHILDTNSPWISRKLAALGIDLYFHSTVGDNQGRMEEVLRTALNRSSLIIITGGLGPTTDDLTREVVSLVMGSPLKLHLLSLKKIEERFSIYHRAMTANNKKQAYLPEGSIPIENNWGTAPGFILEKDHKVIIALPGVPVEMKGMMTESVLPFLQKKTAGKSLYSKVLRIYGIGESSLETRIRDLLDAQSNPTIALLAERFQVKIRLTMKAESQDEAHEKFQFLEEKIQERIGEDLYSYGESMEEVVMQMLQEKGLTLSLAESVTGGLVSHQLTNIPGASNILLASFIVYTREAKRQLGMEDIDLEEGCVSSRITLALARKVRQLTGSSIGAAVTGLAGPGKGNEMKPLGSVYIAISSDSREMEKKTSFPGTRLEIKERSALFFLDGLRRLVNKL